MRNLILHQLSKPFDAARETLVGPWCVTGAEHLCPQWEDMTFPDPFALRPAYVEADNLTRRLANRLAAEWADKQNREHGLTRSPDFWRTLMHHWLMVSVQATWSRYRYMESFIAEHGDSVFSVTLSAEPESWQFDDFDDFFENVNNGRAFDFWLNSLIVRDLAPAIWKREEGSARPKKKSCPAPTGIGDGGGIAAMVRRLFGRFAFDVAMPGRMWKAALAVYVAALPKRTGGAALYRFDDETIGDRFPAAYLKVLDRVLEKTRPTCLGENFASWDGPAAGLGYRPGRLWVGNVGVPETASRFNIAHALEKGERLVAYQHGSKYGTALTPPWCTELEYPFLAFITWGWHRQGEAKGAFVALPSPQLSAIRNAHRFRDDRMLFVGTTLFVCGHRFDSTPMPGHWATYRKGKKTFIDGLATQPRRHVVYCPYVRKDYGFEDGAYMSRAFPDLTLLDGDLTAAMLGCRLLVLDHPGTTLYQAMAANVPLVCFWDDARWPLSEQAEPSFGPLRAAGILFGSPDAAAEQINRIWPDITAWWAGPDVQKARRGFVENYALTSPLWWIDWLRALTRLARQSPHAGNDRALEKKERAEA